MECMAMTTREPQSKYFEEQARLRPGTSRMSTTQAIENRYYAVANIRKNKVDDTIELPGRRGERLNTGRSCVTGRTNERTNQSTLRPLHSYAFNTKRLVRTATYWTVDASHKLCTRMHGCEMVEGLETMENDCHPGRRTNEPTSLLPLRFEATKVQRLRE